MAWWSKEQIVAFHLFAANRNVKVDIHYSGTPFRPTMLIVASDWDKELQKAMEKLDDEAEVNRSQLVTDK